MQRKSTPLSHPFHALFRPLLVALFPLLSLHASAAEPLFHIECPGDVWVDCNAELWDLSIYGNATVYGYNGPESAGPPVSEVYHLNSCDVGTIVRTWVAYDYGGYPHSCSQTIYVTGTGGQVDIHWPPDYIIHSCNPLTDPDDLPAPYDKPVVYGGGSCTQLLTNHEDQIFDINPPACRKILRKWTVIDWCEYDPHAYHPTGIWEYTQVIKITPASPPTITCPPDVTVSSGNDCSAGYVQMDPAVGSSDCGAGVHISNNSPYAYQHGADASGNYPVGTTKVTFWADDGCGQKTSCSTYITVTDMKKPTPVCFYGISVSLMQMPDGYYMDLRPSFFDKGSFDNCTPKSELKMWVEPGRVDCEDLGSREVRLYVEDESGNVQYCNTLVYVQDNMGMCPPSDGLVEGTVHSRNGHMLNDVKVMLDGTSTFDMTDAEGTYGFNGLRYGRPYTVRPDMKTDNLSGVSTLDMVVLLKHILGMQPMTSPYQFIAADLDRSNRVSVNDLLLMKNLILQHQLGAQVTTTWRYIDASYAFPDPVDPFANAFPERYDISSLDADMTSLDFIGVKLGDLNDDAPQLTSGEEQVLVRGGKPILNVTERDFIFGEEFDVFLTMDQYVSLDAMECGLQIDPAYLEVISSIALQNIPGLDVIDQIDEKNVLSVLWYGVSRLNSEQIVKLHVRARAAGKVSDALTLVQGARAIAYLDNTNEARPIQLEFNESSILQVNVDPAGAVMKVGQNTPNPFAQITSIPIELPEAGTLIVQVFDMQGRVLYSREIEAVAGWQELQLNAADMSGRGVLLCRITSEFGSATVRMLVQDPR